MDEPQEAIHVVVADDDGAVAAALARALPLFSPCPLTVAIACDGREALRLATRSVKPHAVILDLAMPNMDGFQAAAAIRDELGDSAPLLLALSGDRRSVEVAGRSALFAHALSKPVDVEELMSRLLGGANCP